MMTTRTVNTQSIKDILTCSFGAILKYNLKEVLMILFKLNKKETFEYFYGKQDSTEYAKYKKYIDSRLHGLIMYLIAVFTFLLVMVTAIIVAIVYSSIVVEVASLAIYLLMLGVFGYRAIYTYPECIYGLFYYVPFDLKGKYEMLCTYCGINQTFTWFEPTVSIAVLIRVVKAYNLYLQTAPKV
jgi:hypothetical protein